MFKNLRQDESGAAMVEMSIVFLLLVMLTFGLVDFGRLFYCWNSAEKATQLGVRMAVVDDLVATELADFDCRSGSMLPGDLCSDPEAASFGTVVCQGATQACSGGYSFDASAFQRIVARMRAIYPDIKTENVFVQYTDLGLGFAGRGGPVGAVTVGLANMTFDFVVIGSLLGFGSIGMPDFRASLTSEDLSSGGTS